jgi:hypothetical protein
MSGGRVSIGGQRQMDKKKLVLEGRVVTLSTWEFMTIYVGDVELIDAVDEFMGKPLETKVEVGSTKFIYGNARIIVELMET